MKIEESSPNGWRTLWEKAEIAVTSNFSFSHSVLKSPVPQTRKNLGFVWERANGVYFLRFCTKCDAWFSKYGIELIVALSSTNATKRYGRRFNPFLNKPWFLHVCTTSLLKTLWEKEKLLVTSNFSSSHSVFYPFRELCHFHQNLNCGLQYLSV